MIITAYLSARLIIPMLLDFLGETGTTRPNFRGYSIPLGAGLVFPIVFTVVVILSLIINDRDTVLLVYLYAVYAASFLGFIDDLLGNTRQKGLKGHFLFLYKEKKFTTGTLKAFGIVGAAFIAALYAQVDEPFLVLDWVLIFLCVNTVNLLDLRPGRALKGSLLLLFVSAVSLKADYRLLGIVLAIILAYAPYDLQAKVMLGDTGSNVLGMLCGLALIHSSLITKTIMLFVFAVLHAVTEKFSLSEFIEKNPFLRILDQWGRSKI